MSDDDARAARSISGGSVQEAELGAAPKVAWTAKRDRADSPFAQGVRRLRRSTTALIGAFIVALLLVVALLADVLAPQSPIASDQALMRRSLLPGLWSNVVENAKHRESFRIFEVGLESVGQASGLP